MSLPWRVSLLVALAASFPGSQRVARHYIFPAPTQAPALPESEFEVLRTRARDGVPVRALALAGPAGARVVVHFHNNRETAEAQAFAAHALREQGLGVVLAEYRGYGRDAASAPTEDGLYADAAAVLDQLVARGVGPERTVLWGTSLGTGVAAEMARRGRGSRLVLVTPYTSIPDLVTDVVPLAPARWLVADHFDTLTKAPDIAVPTLIVHGDADEIVPFWMGELLARRIPQARLLRVPGGKHGDLFVRHRERLFAAIAAHGA